MALRNQEADTVEGVTQALVLSPDQAKWLWYVLGREQRKQRANLARAQRHLLAPENTPGKRHALERSIGRTQHSVDLATWLRGVLVRKKAPAPPVGGGQ